LKGVINTKSGTGDFEEITVRAQSVGKIKAYVESLANLTVRFLWCGIQALTDPDTWAGGLVIQVEYVEYTTAVGVKIDGKHTWLPFRPWEVLLAWIRTVYGLENQDLVFISASEGETVQRSEWRPNNLYEIKMISGRKPGNRFILSEGELGEIYDVQARQGSRSILRSYQN
jgi:hypothetical protein